MWGSLIALALLLTINPLRIGIILLVLSRPRPMQNLLAYWVGVLLSGLFYLVVPLIVLHSVPASAALARGFVNSEPNPAVLRTLIGVGGILLILAALLASRSRVRAPSGGPAAEPPRSGGTSTTTLDPSTMPIISRLMRSAPDGDLQGGSRVRRLLRRGREAWQSGSPWIAFLIGLTVMPADGVLLALAVIFTSGVTVGLQVGAAIVFVILVLTVEEVILVSNLLVPEKTQAVLRRLHEWSVIHHRKFMAAILALVGFSLILQGLRGL